MTKIQNMCWAPFLVRILDSTHSTTKREANLTYSAFNPDSNRLIIKISNFIFLPTQTLYLIPELSSVFKCLLGEILINKYVGAFQLSTTFQDILFVFKIQQTTDDCPWLILFAIFCFFSVWALSMILLSSMSSVSLKCFSTSASLSSQLFPTFSLIPSILRLFLLE